MPPLDGASMMKPTPNTFHVMRSMDVGEMIAHPWLPKHLAEKLAAVLNEIEDDRAARNFGEDGPTARAQGVGEFYYVKETEKPKRRA